MNWRHLVYDQLGSTNSLGKILPLGAHEAVGVIAIQQLAGRGQQGRAWHAPAGNLSASFVLPYHGNITQLPTLSLQIGLWLRDVIVPKLAYPDKLKLKWPNDLFYEDQKLAGILIETDRDQDNLLRVVIGIGVNILASPDIPGQMTTNLQALGVDLSASQLYHRLIEKISQGFNEFIQYGFTLKAKHEWLAHAYGLGTEMTWRLAKQIVTAEFIDISSLGAAIFRTPDGLITQHSGDCEVVYASAG